MNRQIRLRPVRRPETSAGDVRQNVVVGGWHSWNSVNCLLTVGTPQKTVARIIQLRVFLQVVRPVRDKYRIPGAAIGFDSVLVDGSVDHTQIIKDSAGLGTFSGTEESGHRDRRQERDDRNYDHNFHEGEAPAAFVKFVQHC